MKTKLSSAPCFKSLCRCSPVVVLAIATSLSASTVDITTPGDPVQTINGVNDGDLFAGPPPSHEGVEHAIDNFGRKYLNFLDLDSGFAVQPSFGPSTVTGLRLYTANDTAARDPASFVLSGGSSLAGPWTEIASGPLALPDGRNPSGVLTPNLSAFHQDVSFANAAAYSAYKLVFPTLKDAAAANSMQVGDVELLATANRPQDVTQPGDPVQIINGVNDGDLSAGPPPNNEGVEHAIDNFDQKYLNFLDLGSGFAVQPSIGPSILTGLRLHTANDTVARDPASFVLSGGGSLAGPWTEIASGLLALPDGRLSPQEISFANALPFDAYRLVFPTLKDAAAANSMQIGEVEFLGGPVTSSVPESGSGPGMAAMAFLALLLMSRLDRFPVVLRKSHGNRSIKEPVVGTGPTRNKLNQSDS